MRIILIILIILVWILLGYGYYSLSRTCCSTDQSELSSPTKSAELTDKVSSMEYNHGAATGYVFSKSGIKLTDGEQENIPELLPFEADKGIEIEGHAYADEQDSHQLALLRAKEIQTQLGLKSEQVRLKAFVSDQDYSEDKVFISYNIYDQDPSNQAGDTNRDDSEFKGILKEGKKVYFYLDAYDKSSGLSNEIKSELSIAASKLRNNFCKIVLTSYNDNKAQGRELGFQFKEQLIRSGLTPSRIVVKSEKQGDRNTSMVELRIID